MKYHYELQVWNKLTKRYDTTWWGQNFIRAQIMAAKPYNNYNWQGKKRIIKISVNIELEIPHIGKKRIK